MRVLLPLLWGVGCGALTAWGVGGGSLLLLVMTLFAGVEQREAQGVNLLFFLPAAGGALLRHIRENNVDWPTVRRAVPAALAGALAGAWIASAADVTLLRRPFGAGLLTCGALTLLRG